MTSRTEGIPRRTHRWRRVPPASGLGGVGSATAAAAVLGWLVMIVVGRQLGPQGYAGFSVQWGLYFAIAGVMFGVQQEITRSVAATTPRDVVIAAPSAPPHGRGSLVRHVAMVSALVVLVFLVSSPLWAPGALGTKWELTVVLMAAGLLFLGVQSSITGVIAARREHANLSAMVVVSAAIRLVVVGLACQLDAPAPFLTLGIVGGSAAWLLLLPKTSIRSALGARDDGHSLAFMTRAASTIAASVCAALLATGFPFLLRLTSSAPLDASAGILLAAVVTTRTPLLLPLNGYQLLILGYFVRQTHGPFKSLRSFVGVLTLVGAVSAGAGTLIGPWVLTVLFGPGFEIGHLVVGLLVIAAFMLVLLTLTGTALLSRGHHGRSLAGWLVAVGATCGALLLPLDDSARALTALLVGPVLGVAVHLALATSPGSRRLRHTT